MAKAFKKKKLPKYFGGGSMYDEQGQQQYGQNTQKVAGYAQMAGGLAQSIGGNEDRYQGDFRTQNNQTEGAVMGAVGQIGPVGQVIQGAYNVGQAIGDPIRARSEATDEKGKLKNEKAARRNAVVGSFFDPFKALQTRASYKGGWTDISGKGYAKHLESEAQKRIAEEQAPIREAERQDMMNKLSSGTFRQGGISYPTNAIPIHGGNWAIPTFPNGGTFQVNGPTHENGGVEIQSPNGNYEIEKEEAVQVTPEADRILSDNNKLKLISTGRNPAQSYKPYQSKLDKLNKLASKGKLDKYGLESLKLTDMASKKAFDNFYDEQESLKITKVNNYIKRLGGLAQYQDGGPKRNKPTGYEEAILVDPSKLPSDYKFKQRTTTQLGGGRTEVTNLYNKPVVDKAIPGGKPDDKWEKSIINRLQSGESPEDLRDKGFFGDEGVEKYAKFYRPLKTVTTQEAPKTDAKLYGEKTIAGKLMPRGYAEQPWDTYRTFPEAGKANVYTDVNYYQGKPIDLTKSFNSGKFVPSYLDSNATGTYLQQQGTEMNRNPLDTLPGTDVKNLKSYSINRYGGIQKYSGGGKKSLVFKPKPITEDAGVEYPSVPNSIYQEPYNSQDVIDPRFRTKPGLNDTEAELLVKSAQEQSKKYEAEQLAKEQGSPKYNWKDTAYQVGTGLASNMGEILALHKASKPVEVQKMYEYSPEKLDFIPTERSYRAKRRMVLENVKNLAGGSSGTALSNIAAQNAALTEQEDSARREFANINAGIGNQAKQFNIGNRYATDDINARNRAAKQNLQLKATERMGSNIAQQAKDYRMSEQDKEMLPFLQQAFSDPSFKAMLAQWAKTKGYSK